MRSTFSGLSIGISGLQANKRSLDTVSHNISNANNPYYVRQQAIQSTSRYNQLPGGGMQLGTGVQTQEIRQIRDEFLDIKYRSQTQTWGYWAAKENVFSQVQEIVNETTNSGLQKVMDQFWNSWSEVAKEPDNLTARGLLVERSIAFTETINHISHQLDMLQLNLNNDIKAKVDEINSIGKSIADLNMKIMKNESVGMKANDFRDMRNNLLDRLSELVAIDYHEDHTGAVHVSVGGGTLVSSTHVNEMSAHMNQSSFVDVYWKDTLDSAHLQKVNILDGELKGLIEGRGDVDDTIVGNRNGTVNFEFDPIVFGSPDFQYPNNRFNDLFKELELNKISNDQIIPSLKQQLNIFVMTIATAVNDVHKSGLTLTGDKGEDFFVRMNDNLPLQAGNIKLNPELINLNNIAASDKNGGLGNGKNAEAIVALRGKYLYSEGKLNVDDFYRQIISNLGVEANKAMVMRSSQDIVRGQIDDKRKSLSAVSLDEEMTDMLKYQHSYIASSRVVNAIDEMVDTIINRMGIVGR